MLDECTKLEVRDGHRPKFSKARDLLELDPRWQVKGGPPFDAPLFFSNPTRPTSHSVFETSPPCATHLVRPCLRLASAGVEGSVGRPCRHWTVRPNTSHPAAVRCPRIFPAQSLSCVCCPRQAVDSGREREELYEDWLDEKEKAVRLEGG